MYKYNNNNSHFDLVILEFHVKIPQFMCLLSACRHSGLGTMRRGMLMTVLQQYAVEQQVWKGKPGER